MVQRLYGRESAITFRDRTRLDFAEIAGLAGLGATSKEKAVRFPSVKFDARVWHCRNKKFKKPELDISTID